MRAIHRNHCVGPEVRRRGEAVREVVGQRIEHVQRREAEDLVEGSMHAEDGGVPVRDVAAFRPGTDHQQHAPLGVHVIRFTAGVVLRHEDRHVLPIGSVGEELHDASQREIVVCHP